MLDRVLGMEVFTRTAARGSFSAAARSLGLSPTMVTKHIVGLEDRLGVQLFQRTTRRLSLTEAGRTYLDFCSRILPEIEEMEQVVSSGQIEPRGLLRVNAPLSFGSLHIAPAMVEFSRLHPQVTVELGLSDRMVDMVEEGWDLTIRIGRLVESSLKARQIASTQMVVCASPIYLKARGTPQTVAELADHNCLTYTLSSVNSLHRWTFGDNGKIAVTISGTLRINNGEALRNAAIAGHGIIYEPRFLLYDALRCGSLVALPLDNPPITELEIHAVYAPTRQVPLKTRAMIQFLAARFKGKHPV